MKGNDDDLLLARQMVAGGAAGAITKTCIAPLERVKILLQVQGIKTDLPPGQQRYGGLVSSSRRILAEDGVRGFWKGNGANVVRVIPTYGLKFALNDQFKAMVARPGQAFSDLGSAQLMGAGFAAGFVQYLCTYPLELVRTRLALNQTLAEGARFSGMLDCARAAVAKEGLASLYKGMSITLFSGPMYVSLQMTLYQKLQNWWRLQQQPDLECSSSSKQQQHQLTLASRMWMGAVSGVVAQGFMYPGDTIKRQLQSNGINGAPKRYRSIPHALRSIYTGEGVAGFYRGFAINTIRSVPGAAIQFASYDVILKCLRAGDQPPLD